MKQRRDTLFSSSFHHIHSLRRGVVGNIFGSHPDTPGSIPGDGVLFFATSFFLLSSSSYTLILFVCLSSHSPFSCPPLSFFLFLADSNPLACVSFLFVCLLMFVIIGLFFLIALCLSSFYPNYLLSFFFTWQTAVFTRIGCF